MATGFIAFYLNSGGHPITPSVSMHGGCVSSHVEAVPTMINGINTALEEDLANLTITQRRPKAYADKSYDEL